MALRLVFKLNRRTRHGAPFSAYLFILVLKIVFIQIRECDDMKGFVIGGVEIKLTAFADDSSFFLKDIGSLELLCLCLVSIRS